jgi:hypothetical protein
MFKRSKKVIFFHLKNFYNTEKLNLTLETNVMKIKSMKIIKIEGINEFEYNNKFYKLIEVCLFFQYFL